MQSGYTVIIPTFNRSDIVGRALRSVAAQSVAPTQVVLVDDGSDEDIAAVAAAHPDLPIDLVTRETRGGPAAARNTGLDAARAEIIAFLDSDDEWLPDKMAAQLAYLDANPTVGCCCAGFLFDIPGMPRQTRGFGANAYLSPDLAFGCGLSPGTTLCARHGFLSGIGAFDTAYPRLEDWDWLIRAAAESPIGIVDRPLAIVHGGGPPTEGQVAAAVARMRAKHSRRFFRLGLGAGLRFQAALLNELAVAAFRNRRYGPAGLYFVAALATYPIREREYFLRIGRKVLQELRP
jgi:GT2 family glycosyltransferase